MTISDGDSRKAMTAVRKRLIAGVASLCAFAASADEYKLGGGFLGRADLEATAVSIDNFFYQGRDPISANGYRVRPSIGATRPGSNTRLSVSSFLEHSDFDLPGDLDHYLDYGADGSLAYRPWRRHAFDLAGVYRRGHDPAGLQRTEAGVADFSRGQVDEWDQKSISLNYRYGAADAIGSNTLRVAQSSREYVTNRNDTVFLNFTNREVGYELAYEYSPKTAFLLIATHRSIDFERPVLSTIGNRNGNELTLRTGLRWVATGKTSGDVQVGVRSYSVDGRAQPSRQSLSWKANVIWDATQATSFKLNTGRSTVETFRSDVLFIDERKAGLQWQQTWTNRLNTTLGVDYTQSQFVGTSREDDLIAATASLDFLVARQLKAFGQYSSRTRDSSSRTLDYDAPEAKIGLRWSL